MAQEEMVAIESSAAAAPIPQQDLKKSIQEPVVVAVTKAGSFKEETNLKKALDELKSLLQSSNPYNEFIDQPLDTTKPEELAAGSSESDLAPPWSW